MYTAFSYEIRSVVREIRHLNESITINLWSVDVEIGNVYWMVEEDLLTLGDRDMEKSGRDVEVREKKLEYRDGRTVSLLFFNLRT